MDKEKPGDLVAEIPAEGGAKDKADPHTTPAAVTSGVGDRATTVLAPKAFKPWNEVTYFHAEDRENWQGNVERTLRKELGIEHRVGASKSAQGAIREIEALARKNQSIDVIVLDQSFFVAEGDDVDDANACREFLNGFTKLLEQPDTKVALKDTIIIMYSGSTTTEFLQEMQKICPRVKYLVDKSDETDRMAAIVAIKLSDAGVVDPNDQKVLSARELLSKPHKF